MIRTTLIVTVVGTFISLAIAEAGLDVWVAGRSLLHMAETAP